MYVGVYKKNASGLKKLNEVLLDEWPKHRNIDIIEIFCYILLKNLLTLFV